MKKLRKMHGFTLLELLLVMVIMSAFIFMGVGYVQQRAVALRMDRTSLQIQQILNAALAYYVANGAWPTTTTPGPTQIKTLQSDGYLAPGTIKSPWGTDYKTTYTSKGLFYVWVPITLTKPAEVRTYGNVIAGKLPFGYISGDAGVEGDPSPGGSGVPPDSATTCTTGTCYVVSYVNIPGQNLNNASAINFAGLYHHGACVPVPTCPVDAKGNTMTPQVMIVPISVSGVNDSNSTNVYPISSFTAYATGSTPLNTAPPLCDGQTGTTRVWYNSGSNSTISTSCSNLNLQNSTASTQYWRACLQVITERGDVQSTRSDQWGQHVTLLAVTRCAMTDEPSGSAFTVYGN